MPRKFLGAAGSFMPAAVTCCRASCTAKLNPFSQSATFFFPYCLVSLATSAIHGLRAKHGDQRLLDGEMFRPASGFHQCRGHSQCRRAGIDGPPKHIGGPSCVPICRSCGSRKQQDSHAYDHKFCKVSILNILYAWKTPSDFCNRRLRRVPQISMRPPGNSSVLSGSGG